MSWTFDKNKYWTDDPKDKAELRAVCRNLYQNHHDSLTGHALEFLGDIIKELDACSDRGYIEFTPKQASWLIILLEERNIVPPFGSGIRFRPKRVPPRSGVRVEKALVMSKVKGMFNNP